MGERSPSFLKFFVPGYLNSGATIVTRLAQVNLWNKPMNESPTKVHIAPCITDHCPYSEALIKKIKAKAGVEVIEGAHPYKPNDIFA